MKNEVVRSEYFTLDLREKKPQDQEMTLTVSPICGTGADAYAFVTFTEGDKTAEGKIPACVITKNSGFSEEELAGLAMYMKTDLKHLQKLAAGENVFKAMLKGTGEK